MRHIIAWSGGKDSTCTVIKMHELLEEGILDIPRSDIEVVIAEVMYCNKRGISAESRIHLEFVEKARRVFEEEFGFRTVVLISDRDFLSCFNHVMEKAVKHPENIGKRYGFPLNGMCVIQRDCKIRPMERYLEQVRGDYVQYLGICADETNRLKAMHKKPYTRSLLEEYGIIEKMTVDICKKYDLYSPTYEYSSRNGCFFCCNSKLYENAQFKQEQPGVWEEFVNLEKEENLAHSRWNVFKETLAERDRRVDEILLNA